MTDEQRRIRGEWHVAINKTAEALGHDKTHFMYFAKEIEEEAGRLPCWFAKERTGAMPQVHRQCSHSDTVEIVDNHLTCCLGVECRNCEFLQNLERQAANIPPEEMDKLKTWTCIAHIAQVSAENPGHVDTSEGMILTTGDRMFWDNVYRYRSLSATDDDSE